MKKAAIIFYLLILLSSNSFSRETDIHSIPEAESGYINVDGGKLYYEIAGEGEYIVLLHDGILHREVWDEQFPVLAERYRVVRYDRRGYGKSFNPQAPFSHIDDLNQLFIQLGIDKAILFGMSGGGMIAIDFTLQYPEKVNGLVLIGAVVSGYGLSEHFFTRGGHISSLADYLEPQKFIKYFGWEDPYEVYPQNVKAKERFLRLLEANPLNVNGALGYFVKPLERDAVKFLCEIKVPVLVLVGEYDIPDVHAHSGVIEAGIPNAKREIVFKAGHLIPLEQPEAFNSSVMKFLNGLEFFNILDSQGVDSAVQYFHKKRETEPGIILFEEREMNLLGYRYLQNGKIKDAIELFRLNATAFPDSWNAYDSLGEAYLLDGQKDLAIKYYEKSLELNPKNTNAQEKLRGMKKLISWRLASLF
jgi:pimeloyl-ACP methyl ester carboxylesterase